MNLKQKDSILITDSKVIKLLNKPLIRDIINCLSDSPKTATEISTLVTFPKDKIYYHIKNLIKHDILYISDIKKINGVDQKMFFPRSKNFITNSNTEKVKNTTPYYAETKDDKKIIKNVENNNKDIKYKIKRSINRRRRIERRTTFRRQYIVRRVSTKIGFKGNEKREKIDRRINIEQRVQINRRQVFDRRITKEKNNETNTGNVSSKKDKITKNRSIPFKNYLLKMRGVKEAISFVYDGYFVSVLHCKLSKIGFEVYSCNKYKLPFVQKDFTIHTLPEFIISILDQIFTKEKLKKIFLSISSDHYQYEMTYAFNKKQNNKKFITNIFKSFSLDQKDILSDIKKVKSGQSSIIYSKNKQLITEDVTRLKKFGINLRYNTSIPKSIYNLFKYYNLNDGKSNTLLCYIGNQKTHIILCQNKTIIGSSDFPKGLHFFLKRLMSISTKSSIGDQIYFDAAHYLSFYGIGAGRK